MTVNNKLPELGSLFKARLLYIHTAVRDSSMIPQYNTVQSVLHKEEEFIRASIKPCARTYIQCVFGEVLHRVIVTGWIGLARSRHSSSSNGMDWISSTIGLVRLLLLYHTYVQLL